MRPISVEVIAPLITTMEFGCSKCGILFKQLDAHKDYHSSCKDEYPEDWKHDAAQLMEHLKKMSETYKHRIRIKLIDAQSPLGLWKQIRHRLFCMPAFIVDGKGACAGWDTDRVEQLIDARIHEASREIAARVTERASIPPPPA
jgi:hypothetical protein